MAKSGDRALGFVDDLRRRCAARLCARVPGTGGVSGPGGRAPRRRARPWEVAFRAERLRRADYDFDEEELRPFFPMDRVISGLFELAGRVFGVRVAGRPRGQVETWHPDVGFYDVHDSRGRHIGSFYADWHPARVEARRGLDELPDHGRAAARRDPQAPSGPDLRQPDAARAGSASRCSPTARSRRSSTSSGTCSTTSSARSRSSRSTGRTWPGTSSNCRRRSWRTGAGSGRASTSSRGTSRPARRFRRTLFRKMTAARNFRSACATMRQVAFAKMDLLLHMRAAEFAAEADVEAQAARGDRRLPRADRPAGADDRQALHPPLLRSGGLCGGLLLLQVGRGARRRRLHPFPPRGHLQRAGGARSSSTRSSAGATRPTRRSSSATSWAATRTWGRCSRAAGWRLEIRGLWAILGRTQPIMPPVLAFFTSRRGRS